MKVEMTEEEYISLKEFIDINKLDIEILSVVADKQLFCLGFVEQIPYVVELRATEETIEYASEIAMSYEISVYNTPNGDYPSEDTEDYKLYENYGWIWDLFNSDHWKWYE